MAELNPIPNQAYTPTSTHNTDTFTPRAHLHNDPTGIYGAPVQSTIGEQAATVFYIRKALVDAALERKFGQMANSVTMPKHMGKRIRLWQYFPLLDDRNLNDQGIDARGAQIKNGNLYGSTKDIGKIVSRLPALQEIGGRVNRVGFSRTQIEGTFNSFGFFYEYSKDFMDLDSDSQVLERMYREAIIGAEKINEDMLQIDLLHGAGTLVYAGSATSDETLNEDCTVTYRTLTRLRDALNDNRTPKSTKVITGSTNIDTRTLTTHRVLFVGSEIATHLETLKDPHGLPAFIPLHQYQAGLNGKPLNGEIGAIAGFRVIQCEEMKHWAGRGDNADQDTIRSTGGKYDVFPLLCLGSEAFSTIGFNGSNGVQNKFEIHHMKPQVTSNDPYGKIGLVSIQWNYGILIERPERIGLIKCVAPL